jgi:hypothetical protein
VGVTPVAGIHRPDLAVVDREQLAAEQVEPSAQHDELPAHPLERRGVIAAEVRDGLEVRREPRQQPHQLDVPVRLVFQSSTRADAVQVEPQEISRIVARPPGLGWHRPLKPQGIEVELGHEGVQEADGVIGPVRRQRRSKRMLTL